MSGFESIQTVIKEVSHHHGLGVKLLEARLHHEWEGLVGTTLAKHSSPGTIRYRKLNVIADNSIWLQQLLFLKPQILESVQTMFPQLDVSDIVLRLGSVPQKPSPPETVNELIPSPPVLPTPFARELSNQLLNPDLQALFSRTISQATQHSVKDPPPSLSGERQP